MVIANGYLYRCMVCGSVCMRVSVMFWCSLNDFCYSMMRITFSFFLDSTIGYSAILYLSEEKNCFLYLPSVHIIHSVLERIVRFVLWLCCCLLTRAFLTLGFLGACWYSRVGGVLLAMLHYVRQICVYDIYCLFLSPG